MTVQMVQDGADGAPGCGLMDFSILIEAITTVLFSDALRVSHLTRHLFHAPELPFLEYLLDILKAAQLFNW